MRAVYPDMARHKTAASLLLTPLQPLAMTCANTAGVEVSAILLNILLWQCHTPQHLLCCLRLMPGMTAHVYVAQCGR